MSARSHAAPSSRRRRRALSVAAVLALVLAVAACDSSDVTPPDGSGAPPASADATAGAALPSADPAAVAAVAQIIAAVDTADPATLDALDNARWADGAPEAAAQALAAGGDADTRWAAALVYATAGDDAAVLKPLLTDEDPSVRATAAITLLAAGDRDAIPVLVALSGSEEQLRGSRPPLVIGRWVADTLAQALDPAMYAPDASGPPVQQAWEAWLTAHQRGITFDRATGTWSVK